MNINNLLVKYTFEGSSFTRFTARIPTKSKKYFISVVAGDGLYSTPREDMDIPEYTEFEIAICDANNYQPVFVTGYFKEQLEPIFGEIYEDVIGYVTQEQIWACVDAI